jgi:tRNA G18 (ribose-2'-O)-methylase SpoU
MNVQQVSDGAALVALARTKGYQLVAVQQTPSSEAYHLADYPPQPLFMMGAEDLGLPDSLRLAADLAIEIPMFGEIDSLNVATAATTVMFHWRIHHAPRL